MHVRPVGPNAGGYYLQQGAGAWVGSGAADLGLGGEVVGPQLRAALDGRHPSSGRFLPEVRTQRRRSGWDLVFTAPKSLSLLAMSHAPVAEKVASAQRAAVEEALSHFEECHLHVRRAGRVAAASGAIAAQFDHQTNAGGEPHLHSHLLVVNLARDLSGRWSSIGGWWLERRTLNAVYVLGLRHHLAARGIDVEWRLRADGLVDVAGVPRAAVRAASTRSHEASQGGRHAGRTSDPNRPWRDRSLAAGWDAAAARPGPSLDRGGRADLTGAVTTRLALKGSTFGRRDVLLALGACPDARFTAGEARRWVDLFLTSCTEVTSGIGGAHPTMWRTKLAESADRRLEDVVRERTGIRAISREVSPQLPRAEVQRGTRACAERILSGDPVVVLTCPTRDSRFLSHATVVAECAQLCASAGMTVAVNAPTRLDALRWHTLAGIDQSHPSRRADVLFVDQADRRTSAELSVILGSAPAARIVLVEGGTSLRVARPASRLLERPADGIPRLATGGPPVRWDVLAGDQTHPAVGLLGCWAASITREGSPVMLVALGVPETEALNDAARRHLASLRQLAGPELTVRGRGFRLGDTVITVRPLGPGLPAGTLGTVVEVNLTNSTAAVQWPQRVTTVGRRELARIGHGYAATPRLGSRANRPALVLGPAEGIGLERVPVLDTFTARGLQGPGRTRDRAGAYGPETWPVHR